MPTRAPVELSHRLRQLRNIALNRLYMSRRGRDEAVERFHRLYYDSKGFGATWDDTRWLGVPVLKCPFDLWTYQELVTELRPDLIVETGTYDGGSAFFLASLCDLVGNGEIVSVDIAYDDSWPRHERISYVTGSSIDEGIVEQVRDRARGKGVVMVILDSDHSRDHVAAELERYADLVTLGSYLVVEDTNVNGHPVFPNHGPGPHEAVEEFVEGNPQFMIDKSREKFLLTFNPDGWLKRIS